jgi:hypothetical protein
MAMGEGETARLALKVEGEMAEVEVEIERLLSE